MTVPDCLDSGWLPEGVHTATLEEVRARFGSFKKTDRRVDMCAKLLLYLEELRHSGITHEIVIDGSFVSARHDPGDVDVTFPVPDDFLLREPEWTPSERNLVNNAFTRKVYGVDAWAEPGLDAYQRRVRSWSRMKPPAKGTKGVLRVSL